MEIVIGNHKIGPGNPTFVVAEMSGNHGGNLDQALDIVRAAKVAGADAVKLQTYTADTITLKSDKPDFAILGDTAWADYPTLWDLYNKAYTPWEWHAEIFAEARKLGLEIFSSPFDETAVDFLESLNVRIYKVASPEITNVPLLEKIAQTGKPVIISTGISELADIELALKTLRDNGSNEIIILKCTTSYPAPPEESNLLTITDIPKRFGVLAGLSDHTIGTAAPVAAVALGASLIEKHFTTEDGGDTVDSFFSSDEENFKKMVSDIRFVDKALGNISYYISPSALPSLRGRSSLYISAPVHAGEIFTKDNIRAVRPSFGLHPRYYRDILGKKATSDAGLGDRLTWDIVERDRE